MQGTNIPGYLKPLQTTEHKLFIVDTTPVTVAMGESVGCPLMARPNIAGLYLRIFRDLNIAVECRCLFIKKVL